MLRISEKRNSSFLIYGNIHSVIAENAQRVKTLVHQYLRIIKIGGV
jgi:hypothetical protein